MPFDEVPGLAPCGSIAEQYNPSNHAGEADTSPLFFSGLIAGGADIYILDKQIIHRWHSATGENAAPPADRGKQITLRKAGQKSLKPAQRRHDLEGGDPSYSMRKRTAFAPAPVGFANFPSCERKAKLVY